mgnify:CR=1 FL=1
MIIVIRMYKTDIETNKTTETRNFEKGIWINMVAPTEDEIKLVCKKINMHLSKAYGFRRCISFSYLLFT